MHPENTDSPDESKKNPALEKLWSRTCDSLADVIGKSAVERWFAHVVLVRVDDFVWLQAPNEIYSLFVEENYREDLANALNQHLRDCPPIKFEFPSHPQDLAESTTRKPAGTTNKERRKSKPKKAATEQHHGQPDLAKWRRMGKEACLFEKFSFENFVVGDSNRLSHAAATAVAEKPGRTYHPLFIHSSPGLGKTHLLHAIGWEALRLRPKSRVLYISAEQFANEFIAGIQNNALVPFRKKYREDVDLLLIDDIQFLAGKDGMQEEFFHTFNTLSDSHKQIVLASDRPANEIRHLEDRLVTRFQWGMSAEIFTPGTETRIAILRRKREDREIDVPDWAIEFIANQITSDVRAMEGALIRCATISSLNGKPIDEETLESIVDEFVRDDLPQNVNIHDIQNTVAGRYDVSVREMNGKRRTAHLVRARHVAMYLARKLTDLSLAEIGQEFGRRDHGTIHHAVEKIASAVESDRALQHRVENLTRDLTSIHRSGKRDFGGLKDKRNRS